MYLVTEVKSGDFVLINIFHNEADKIKFEKEVKTKWDIYLAEDAIRLALRVKICDEIEKELKNTVDLPKIPFIKNPGLSDNYADAFRGGRLQEAANIMQQIRDIGKKNDEIRRENLKIDRINSEARQDTSRAKAAVLSRLSEDELALHNASFDIPHNPYAIDIVEIDISNFVPVILKSDIYDY